jgi:hypothetical protein
MNVEITSDMLSDEIRTAIQNYDKEVRKAVNMAIKDSADWAAKKLQQGSPEYRERTGVYSRSWRATFRSGSNSSVLGLDTYSVNNSKEYRLTHLLENGHTTRNHKSWVSARKHIQPVTEMLDQIVTTNITSRVSDIKDG